jgi:hypothetical protein
MLTRADKRIITRTITRLAAGTIAILASFLGLALIGMFVFIVATDKIEFEFSVDGSLSLLGLLFIASIGLYFIWIGFSILVLKRVTHTFFLLLALLPPFFLSIAVVSLMKTFWNRPAEGYTLLSGVIFLVIAMVVYLVSFAFILKVFLRIFKKGGYLET